MDRVISTTCSSDSTVKESFRGSVSQSTLEVNWSWLDSTWPQDKQRKMKKKNEKEHRKNPKSKIPDVFLDELREFNHRFRKLSSAKSKYLAIEASILTAQAYLCRRPSNCTSSSSGVGRARKIWEQSKHLLASVLVIVSQSGFGSRHPSMLDNPKIVKVISNWSCLKKPERWVTFFSSLLCWIRFDQSIQELFLTLWHFFWSSSLHINSVTMSIV